MKVKKMTELRSMKDYDHIFEQEYGATFYDNDANPANWIHHHDYYEMVFYFGNTPLKYYYEGKTYLLCKGDIVLCDVFKNHQFCTKKNINYTRTSIGVTPMLLTKLSHTDFNLFRLFNESNPNYPVFHMELVDNVKYVNLVSEYMKLEQDKNAKILQRALVHMILAYLYLDCCSGIEESVKDNTQRELIISILEYIEDHMKHWITLNQISESLNYSVGYLSKVFKDNTGQNLNRYILKKRVDNAKYLIKKGVSIVDAAEQSGFSNYSYFYRALKKIEGLTPRDFQSQNCFVLPGDEREK